jgi:hypothetical protein
VIGARRARRVVDKDDGRHGESMVEKGRQSGRRVGDICRRVGVELESWEQKNEKDGRTEFTNGNTKARSGGVVCFDWPLRNVHCACCNLADQNLCYRLLLSP